MALCHKPWSTVVPLTCADSHVYRSCKLIWVLLPTSPCMSCFATTYCLCGPRACHAGILESNIGLWARKKRARTHGGIAKRSSFRDKCNEIRIKNANPILYLTGMFALRDSWVLHQGPRNILPISAGRRLKPACRKAFIIDNVSTEP